MGVSTRTRFEVFKRDRFTCSYCGRTPPTVLLEVDHIIPRVAGGTDAIENLTTSCQDCNRGKSGNLLEEGSAPAVNRAAVDELQERIDQAKAYAELSETWRRLQDKQVHQVIDAWAKAFQAERHEEANRTFWRLGEGEEWPDERSIRQILQRLPMHLVLEAIDIAAAWARGWSYERTCRYFYGVCWNRIRERGGEDG